MNISFKLREGNKHAQDHCESIESAAMSQPTDEDNERTSTLSWYEPMRHPHPQEGDATRQRERDLPQQMESIFKAF